MPARPAGVLRLGRRAFGPGELLVMAVVDAAGAAGQVRTAVADGADIVTVAAPGTAPAAAEAETITAFVAGAREAFAELVIGVRTGRREVARAACAAGADLLSVDKFSADEFSADESGAGTFRDEDGGLRLAEVAAEYGAAVAGPPGLAARAAAAGVEPERVIVGVSSTGPLGDAVASGWPVLVWLPDQDEAGSLATAAVAAWLGARVFRARNVRAARRALNMVSAIRGDIPPARAVRGLA